MIKNGEWGAYDAVIDDEALDFLADVQQRRRQTGHQCGGDRSADDGAERRRQDST